MGKKSKKVQPVEKEEEALPEANLSKVMYIGHLPHGFYEKQLEGFFSQFGQVTRLRVSRNKKTGKAKHYAFLEFKSPEIAAIAAEAMDGYMMFAQKLDCHVLPVSEVHKDLFKGANKKFRAIPWKKIEANRHDKERSRNTNASIGMEAILKQSQQLDPPHMRSRKVQAQRLRRAVSRDKKRKAALEKAGIDYKYKSLKAKTTST